MGDPDSRAVVVEAAARLYMGYRSNETASGCGLAAVRRLTGWLAVGALVLAGCGAAPRGDRTSPHPTRSTVTAGVSHSDAAPASRVRGPNKILVVMEENHSAAQAQAGMPYLMRLGHRYGYDANYHAVGSPSLPNYLAIAAGSTFGISDDNDPSAHRITAHTVFDQAIAAGKRAKAYVESMPRPCDLTNVAPYAVRHNPWTYFISSRRRCVVNDRSTASLLSDARSNSLPSVGMVIPNMNDDAHDGTLARADAWLERHLPTILSSSDFTSGRLAVIVVFDGSSGGHESSPVLAVVCDANLSGKLVRQRLDQYSLSRWLSQTVGASPLKRAASAPDMRNAFGL